MELEIYCDGSCRNNGTMQAIGAWGFIVLNKDFNTEHIEHQVVYLTTNQRMELQAALEACKYAKSKLMTIFDKVHIYTDSAYLHNCYSQKWYISWRNNGWINSKNQPVANKDLWQKLIWYFEDSQFYFHKVPGHQNNEWNNKIDQIVQTATAQAKENIANANSN